jgi:hypothetical protein
MRAAVSEAMSKREQGIIYTSNRLALIPSTGGLLRGTTPTTVGISTAPTATSTTTT